MQPPLGVKLPGPLKVELGVAGRQLVDGDAHAALDPAPVDLLAVARHDARQRPGGRRVQPHALVEAGIEVPALGRGDHGDVLVARKGGADLAPQPLQLVRVAEQEVGQAAHAAGRGAAARHDEVAAQHDELDLGQLGHGLVVVVQDEGHKVPAGVRGRHAPLQLGLGQADVVLAGLGHVAGGDVLEQREEAVPDRQLVPADGLGAVEDHLDPGLVCVVEEAGWFAECEVCFEVWTLVCLSICLSFCLSIRAKKRQGAWIITRHNIKSQQVIPRRHIHRPPCGPLSQHLDKIVRVALQIVLLLAEGPLGKGRVDGLSQPQVVVLRLRHETPAAADAGGRDAATIKRLHELGRALRVDLAPGRR